MKKPLFFLAFMKKLANFEHTNFRQMSDKKTYSTIRIISETEVKKDYFKKEHVKTFNNCQHLLLELKTTERTFLHFLTEKANENNEIYIDNLLLNDFVMFLKEIKNLNPSIKTLTRYKEKLISLNLLLVTKKSKQHFYINPKYTFKGTETKRIQVLSKLLKDPSILVDSSKIVTVILK